MIFNASRDTVNPFTLKSNRKNIKNTALTKNIIEHFEVYDQGNRIMNYDKQEVNFKS